jgi:UDP-2-acetamido-3-amino-2,3-dideoxy-glucuronate N-acetyltransferase
VAVERDIVVVGCGYWGKNLVRNFSELGALRGIGDTDKDRLKQFQAKYPGVLAFFNYKEILGDVNVRGVVVATPASTHYSLVKEALLADKDVMVEKPLALRVREAEELVTLAKERARVLMVGHILLYHPAIIKLKSMINGGDLGKISCIYSNRLNLGKFRTEENILWSFAPHDISVILHLLNEMPVSVSATGGSYLNARIADVTVTNMDFASGAKAHIFVSWMHPFKEQRLVVMGEKGMVLFDDVNPKRKITLYECPIDHATGEPLPGPGEGRPLDIEMKEPLRAECGHFIECVHLGKTPMTDGEEGLRVLRVLAACQKSLEKRGDAIELGRKRRGRYFVHKTAEIDEQCEIGEGTKIWHYSHILKNCRIGRACVIGQNVSIGPNVSVGDNVKIQNNVSVYEGVTLEDGVFCGPSMVFTNVMNPRSHWPRRSEYKKTLVKTGASLGANSTIVCGSTVGRYAFVGAGALVNRDVPDYALAYGVPAVIKGWVCYCGGKLLFRGAAESRETAACPACGREYNKEGLSVSEIKKKTGSGRKMRTR